ncbi:helix-turn-helix domain-containing protein [Nocardia sp. NPDC049737]|uniref:helix-turn-helix domain-containing protein n=1 Tax=Nocardia sp. NPDC049737 TaxID=3154358 RepID=UPI003416F513
MDGSLPLNPVVELRNSFEDLPDLVRRPIEMVVFGGELPRADISGMRRMAAEFRAKAAALDDHSKDAKDLLAQDDSVGVLAERLRETLGLHQAGAARLGDDALALADQVQAAANDAEKTLCVMFVFGIELAWRIFSVLSGAAAAGPAGEVAAVPVVESMLVEGRGSVAVMRAGLAQAFRAGAMKTAARLSALGPLRLPVTLGKAAALPVGVDAGVQALQVGSGDRTLAVIGPDGENPTGIDLTSIKVAALSGAGGALGGMIAGRVAPKVFPRIESSRLALGLVHGTAGAVTGLGAAALVTGWPDHFDHVLAPLLNGGFAGVVHAHAAAHPGSSAPAVTDGGGAFTRPDLPSVMRSTASPTPALPPVEVSAESKQAWAVAKAAWAAAPDTVAAGDARGEVSTAGAHGNTAPVKSGESRLPAASGSMPHNDATGRAPVGLDSAAPAVRSETGAPVAGPQRGEAVSRTNATAPRPVEAGGEPSAAPTVSTSTPARQIGTGAETPVAGEHRSSGSHEHGNNGKVSAAGAETRHETPVDARPATGTRDVPETAAAGEHRLPGTEEHAPAGKEEHAPHAPVAERSVLAGATGDEVSSGPAADSVDSAGSSSPSARDQAVELLADFHAGSGDHVPEQLRLCNLPDEVLKAGLFDNDAQKSMIATAEIIRRGTISDAVPGGMVLRVEQAEGVHALAKRPVEMKPGEGKSLMFMAAAMQRAVRHGECLLVTTTDGLAHREFTRYQHLLTDFGIDVFRADQQNGFGPVTGGRPAVVVATGETVGHLCNAGHRPPRHALIDEMDGIIDRGERLFLRSEGVEQAAPEATSREVFAAHDFLADALAKGTLSHEDFGLTRITEEVGQYSDGTPEVEFWYDGRAELTPVGREKVEALQGGKPWFEGLGLSRLEMAAAAEFTCRKSTHYVMDAGKIVIIDQGEHGLQRNPKTSSESRWSAEQGKASLAQAVEAKEIRAAEAIRMSAEQHQIVVRADADSAQKINAAEIYRTGGRPEDRFFDEVTGASGTLADLNPVLEKIYGLEEAHQVDRSREQRLMEGAPEVVANTRVKLSAIAEGAHRVWQGGRGRSQEILCHRNDLVDRQVQALVHQGVPREAIEAVDADRIAGWGAGWEGQLQKIFDAAGEQGKILVINRQGQRGVDIAVSEAVQAKGGMFVWMTEVPEQSYIHEQAKNRTARNGDRGSAQALMSPQDALIRKAMHLHGVRAAAVRYEQVAEAHRADPTPENHNNLVEAGHNLRSLVPGLQERALRHATADFIRHHAYLTDNPAAVLAAAEASYFPDRMDLEQPDQAARLAGLLGIPTSTVADAAAAFDHDGAGDPLGRLLVQAGLPPAAVEALRQQVEATEPATAARYPQLTDEQALDLLIPQRDRLAAELGWDTADIDGAEGMRMIDPALTEAGANLAKALGYPVSDITPAVARDVLGDAVEHHRATEATRQPVAPATASPPMHSESVNRVAEHPATPGDSENAAVVDDPATGDPVADNPVGEEVIAAASHYLATAALLDLVVRIHRRSPNSCVNNAVTGMRVLTARRFEPLSNELAGHGRDVVEEVFGAPLENAGSLETVAESLKARPGGIAVLVYKWKDTQDQGSTAADNHMVLLVNDSKPGERPKLVVVDLAASRDGRNNTDYDPEDLRSRRTLLNKAVPFDNWRDEQQKFIDRLSPDQRRFETIDFDADGHLVASSHRNAAAVAETLPPSQDVEVSTELVREINSIQPGRPVDDYGTPDLPSRTNAHTPHKSDISASAEPARIGSRPHDTPDPAEPALETGQQPEAVSATPAALEMALAVVAGLRCGPDIARDAQRFVMRCYEEYRQQQRAALLKRFRAALVNRDGMAPEEAEQAAREYVGSAEARPAIDDAAAQGVGELILDMHRTADRVQINLPGSLADLYRAEANTANARSLQQAFALIGRDESSPVIAQDAKRFVMSCYEEYRQRQEATARNGRQTTLVNRHGMAPEEAEQAAREHVGSADVRAHIDSAAADNTRRLVHNIRAERTKTSPPLLDILAHLHRAEATTANARTLAKSMKADTGDTRDPGIEHRAPGDQVGGRPSENPGDRSDRWTQERGLPEEVASAAADDARFDSRPATGRTGGPAGPIGSRPFEDSPGERAFAGPGFEESVLAGLESGIAERFVVEDAPGVTVESVTFGTGLRVFRERYTEPIFALLQELDTKVAAIMDAPVAHAMLNLDDFTVYRELTPGQPGDSVDIVAPDVLDSDSARRLGLFGAVTRTNRTARQWSVSPDNTVAGGRSQPDFDSSSVDMFAAMFVRRIDGREVWQDHAMLRMELAVIREQATYLESWISELPIREEERDALHRVLGVYVAALAQIERHAVRIPVEIRHRAGLDDEAKDKARFVEAFGLKYPHVTMLGFDHPDVRAHVVEELLGGLDEMFTRFPNRTNIRELRIDYLGDKYTSAVTHYYRDLDLAGRGRMHFNLGLAARPDQTVELGIQAHELGWNPVGDRPFHHDAVHEFVHAIDAKEWLSRDLRQVLSQAWSQLSRSGLINESWQTWLTRLPEYAFLDEAKTGLAVEEALAVGFAEADIHGVSVGTPQWAIHEYVSGGRPPRITPDLEVDLPPHVDRPDSGGLIGSRPGAEPGPQLDVARGEWIKALRLERGLTRKQLTQAAGLANSALPAIESGQRKPRIGSFQRICRALGLDDDALNAAVRQFYSDVPLDTGVAAHQSPGDWVRAVRISKGMTQSVLAHAVGVDPVRIGVYENNRERPRPGLFLRIARVLGVEQQALAEAAREFYRDIEFGLDPAAHNPRLPGSWIAALRYDQDMSSAELARIAGISETSASRIEGGHSPNSFVFWRICRALGVAPEVLAAAARHFYRNLNFDTDPAAHDPASPGSWFVALRHDRDMSQSEVAKAIGSGAGHLYRIESGRSRPRFAVFGRICDVLGVGDELLRAAMRHFYSDINLDIEPAAHSPGLPGSWIAALRNDAGMSGGELARRARMPRDSISQIENQRFRPRLRKFRQLCAALGVGGDVLLEAVERFYDRGRFGPSADRYEVDLFNRYVVSRVGSPEEREVRDEICKRFAWVRNALALRESPDTRDEAGHAAWLGILSAIDNHFPSASFAHHAWASGSRAILRYRSNHQFPDLNNRTVRKVNAVRAQMARMVAAGETLDNTEIARATRLKMADVMLAREILTRTTVQLDAPIGGTDGLHQEMVDRAASAGASDTDFAMMIRAALADMADPDATERLVMLHLVEGVPLAEVAQRVALPVATAGEVFADAVARLRDAFDSGRTGEATASERGPGAFTAGAEVAQQDQLPVGTSDPEAGDGAPGGLIGSRPFEDSPGERAFAGPEFEELVLAGLESGIAERFLVEDARGVRVEELTFDNGVRVFKETYAEPMDALVQALQTKLAIMMGAPVAHAMLNLEDDRVYREITPGRPGDSVEVVDPEVLGSDSAQRLGLFDAVTGTHRTAREWSVADNEVMGGRSGSDVDATQTSVFASLFVRRIDGRPVWLDHAMPTWEVAAIREQVSHLDTWISNFPMPEEHRAALLHLHAGYVAALAQVERHAVATFGERVHRAGLDAQAQAKARLVEVFTLNYPHVTVVGFDHPDVSADVVEEILGGLDEMFTRFPDRTNIRELRIDYTDWEATSPRTHNYADPTAAGRTLSMRFSLRDAANPAQTVKRGIRFLEFGLNPVGDRPFHHNAVHEFVHAIDAVEGLSKNLQRMLSQIWGQLSNHGLIEESWWTWLTRLPRYAFVNEAKTLLNDAEALAVGFVEADIHSVAVGSPQWAIHEYVTTGRLPRVTPDLEVDLLPHEDHPDSGGPSGLIGSRPYADDSHSDAARGAWIKALRLERGMTQKQLAQAVGLTNSALSTIESGKSKPRLGNFQRICRALGLDGEAVTDAIRRFYRGVEVGTAVAAHDSLGSWVAALRNSKGMTRADLARAVDIAPTSITEIENGVYPLPGLFLRIARVLEVGQQALAEAAREFYRDIEFGLDPAAHNPRLPGSWIAALRYDRDMSQAELARTAGIPEQSVGRIERGRTPKLMVFRQICRALEVAPEVLAAAFRHFYRGVNPDIDPAAHDPALPGSWFMALRHDQGMSGSEVAKAIGSSSDLSHIESGRNRPEFALFRRICDVLGVGDELLRAATRYFYPDLDINPPPHTLLGGWIKELRLERGMTQKELARRARMSQPYISAVELGTRFPPVRRLRQLCGALGVGGDVLLEAVEQFYAGRYERSGDREEVALFHRYVVSRVGSSEEKTIRDEICATVAWVPDALARRESPDIRDEAVQAAWMGILSAIESHVPSASFTAHAWGGGRRAILRYHLARAFPDLDNPTLKKVSTVRAQIDRMVAAGEVHDDAAIARAVSYPVADVVLAREILARPAAQLNAPVQGKDGQLSREVADPAATTGFSDTDFVTTVRAALADLAEPDTAERLVMLHLVEGEPLADVAARLGLTVASAGEVLAECVARLRSVFDPHGSAEVTASGQDPIPGDQMKAEPDQPTIRGSDAEPDGTDSRRIGGEGGGPSDLIGSRPYEDDSHSDAARIKALRLERDPATLTPTGEVVAAQDQLPVRSTDPGPGEGGPTPGGLSGNRPVGGERGFVGSRPFEDSPGERAFAGPGFEELVLAGLDSGIAERFVVEDAPGLKVEEVTFRNGLRVFAERYPDPIKADIQVLQAKVAAVMGAPVAHAMLNLDDDRVYRELTPHGRPGHSFDVLPPEILDSSSAVLLGLFDAVTRTNRTGQEWSMGPDDDVMGGRARSDVDATPTGVFAAKFVKRIDGRDVWLDNALPSWAVEDIRERVTYLESWIESYPASEKHRDVLLDIHRGYLAALAQIERHAVPTPWDMLHRAGLNDEWGDDDAEAKARLVEVFNLKYPYLTMVGFDHPHVRAHVVEEILGGLDEMFTRFPGRTNIRELRIDYLGDPKASARTSWHVDRVVAAGRTQRIHFSLHHAARPEPFVELGIRSREDGINPIGDRPFHHDAVHEFIHAIDAKEGLSENLRQVLGRTYSQLSRLGLVDEHWWTWFARLPRYAFGNEAKTVFDDGEALAVGFAEADIHGAPVGSPQWAIHEYVTTGRPPQVTPDLEVDLPPYVDRPVSDRARGLIGSRPHEDDSRPDLERGSAHAMASEQSPAPRTPWTTRAEPDQPPARSGDTEPGEGSPKPGGRVGNRPAADEGGPRGLIGSRPFEDSPGERAFAGPGFEELVLAGLNSGMAERFVVEGAPGIRVEEVMFDNGLRVFMETYADPIDALVQVLQTEVAAIMGAPVAHAMLNLEDDRIYRELTPGRPGDSVEGVDPEVLGSSSATMLGLFDAVTRTHRTAREWSVADNQVMGGRARSDVDATPAGVFASSFVRRVDGREVWLDHAMPTWDVAAIREAVSYLEEWISNFPMPKQHREVLFDIHGRYMAALAQVERHAGLTWGEITHRAGLDKAARAKARLVEAFPLMYPHVAMAGFDHPDVPAHVVEEILGGLDEMLTRFPGRTNIRELRIDYTDSEGTSARTSYDADPATAGRSMQFSLRDAARPTEAVERGIRLLEFGLNPVGDRPFHHDAVHEFVHAIDAMEGLSKNLQQVLSQTHSQLSSLGLIDEHWWTWFARLPEYAFGNEAKTVFNDLEALAVGFAEADIHGAAVGSPQWAIHEYVTTGRPPRVTPDLEVDLPAPVEPDPDGSSGLIGSRPHEHDETPRQPTPGRTTPWSRKGIDEPHPAHQHRAYPSPIPERPADNPPSTFQLTLRETNVLARVQQGMRHEEVAAALDISVLDVQANLASLRRKIRNEQARQVAARQLGDLPSTTSEFDRFRAAMYAALMSADQPDPRQLLAEASPEQMESAVQGLSSTHRGALHQLRVGAGTPMIRSMALIAAQRWVSTVAAAHHRSMALWATALAEASPADLHTALDQLTAAERQLLVNRFAPTTSPATFEPDGSVRALRAVDIVRHVAGWIATRAGTPAVDENGIDESGFQRGPHLAEYETYTADECLDAVLNWMDRQDPPESGKRSRRVRRGSSSATADRSDGRLHQDGLSADEPGVGGPIVPGGTHPATASSEEPGHPEDSVPDDASGYWRSLPADHGFEDEQRQLADEALRAGGFDNADRLLRWGYRLPAWSARRRATENGEWWNSLGDPAEPGALSAAQQALIQVYPHPIGNADGLPATIRDHANRLSISRDLGEFLARKPADQRLLNWTRTGLTDPERKQLGNLVRTRNHLRELDRQATKVPGSPPVHVLSYDSTAFHGKGKAVVALGNVDTAHTVNWHVPGTNTTSSSLAYQFKPLRNLYEETLRVDPSLELASIIWIGYDAPAGPVKTGYAKAAFRRRARVGGDRLLCDIAAFHATRTLAGTAAADRLAIRLYGHSYGSVTMFYAGRYGRFAGLVRSAIAAGSPGAASVRHAAELGIGADNVYVAASWRDLVTMFGADEPGAWSRLNPWLGLGIDPATEAFGGKRIPAEFPDSPNFAGVEATHQGYLHRDPATGLPTDALANVAQITAGRGDTVASVDRRRAGGRVVARPIDSERGRYADGNGDRDID